MIKGYIFDYGGTLDTAGRHWGKVLWKAYVRNGAGVTEQQFRDAYVYAERKLGSTRIVMPDFTFRKTLDVKLGLELDRLAGEGCLDMSEQALRGLQARILDFLYEGVRRETSKSREVLEALGRDYPMVLVSNFYGNIGVVLKEFGLDGLFRGVVESAVVGIRKPDPRIFSLGVKALGIEAEETVVVGDSYDKDIIPAVQAGCHAVWYKGEGWTDREYDETLPDAVITDLSQLLSK